MGDEFLYQKLYGKFNPRDKGRENIQKESKEEQMRKVRNLLSNDVQNSIRSLQKDIDEMRRNLKKDTDDLMASTRQALYDQSSFYDKTYKKKAKFVDTNLPVYDQKRIVDKLEYFNILTHKVEITLLNSTGFEERITSNLIGIETVDWWEYMYLYGILKKFRISYEYEQYKKLPKTPELKYRDIKILNLTFKPIKITTNVQRTEQIKDNKKVLVETGSVYRQVELNVEVPYVPIKKEIEVKRGHLLFHDTVETMEIDHNELENRVNALLIEKNINSVFKNEILNYLKNGRLSGF